MLTRVLFLSFIGLIGFACDYNPFSKEIPVTKLLRRSSTASWQTKHASATGVEAQIPTDLCGFADDPELGVVISLHTLPPPFGTLDDKKCLLEVHIERMKNDDFQTQRATDPAPARRAGVEQEFRKWNYEHHDSISRFDEGQYTYYRYDIGCPNGDVITTVTNVTKVYERGVSLYEKEDDSIVRRILGSLRCLERRR